MNSYHYHQESILHLHICTGTYIFKTVGVHLIACVLYRADQKPHKNYHLVLSVFCEYKIKPVLSSHSSIPPSFLYNKKICYK